MRQLIALLIVLVVVCISLTWARYLTPDPPEIDVETLQIIAPEYQPDFLSDPSDPNTPTIGPTVFGVPSTVEGDALLVGRVDVTRKEECPFGSGFCYWVYSSHGLAAEYIRSGDVWSKKSVLRGAGGGGHVFSRRVVGVDSDGDTAVVGSGLDGSRGQVSVYDRSGDGWSLSATLSASDGSPNDGFGREVSLDGDILLVGAPSRFLSGFGAAYVFERGAGLEWTQTAKLVPLGDMDDPSFGRSTAVHDDLALVGGTGAAHVFRRNDEGWSQVTTVLPCNGMTDATFGTSVALGKTYGLVGAPASDTDPGYVCAFADVASEWSDWSELRAVDGAPGDGFGCAVALDEPVALIGASPACAHASGAGSAYLYTASGDTWVQRAMIAPGTPRAGFGYSVSINGTTAAVSDPYWQDPIETGDPNNPLWSPPGAVHLFRLIFPPVDLVYALVEEVRGLELHHGTHKALTSKLKAALADLEHATGNPNRAAANQLRAFIAQVGALRGKKINSDEADDLVMSAEKVIDLLED